MSNSYNEERLRIEAVLAFINDYEENPEKYPLLTKDVLWNLIEWNVEDDCRDKGTITQDVAKLDDFEQMSDEEYYRYMDYTSGLTFRIDEMDSGEQPLPFEDIEFVNLGYVEDKNA